MSRVQKEARGIGPGWGDGIGGRLEHGSAGIIGFQVGCGFASLGLVPLFICIVKQAIVAYPLHVGRPTRPNPRAAAGAPVEGFKIAAHVRAGRL